MDEKPKLWNALKSNRIVWRSAEGKKQMDGEQGKVS